MKVGVINLLDHFGVMDLQVVLNDSNFATPFAFLLEGCKEVAESFGVITFVKDFIVDQASLLTNCSNNSY